MIKHSFAICLIECLQFECTGTKIVKLCECTGNPAGVNGEFAYVAEPVRPRPATTGGEKVLQNYAAEKLY